MKLVYACAAVLALAGQFAYMPAEKRQALISRASLLIGGQPSAPTRAPSPEAAVQLPPPVEAPPLATALTESVSPDRYGQFQTTIEVEGQRLPVLVDTGASFVSLTFEDAGRVGLRPMPSDFKYKTSTANGVALSAMGELREIRLGSIEVRNVPVLIAARGSMAHSLLGMSFLSRLSGFRVDAGRLVLQR